MFILLFVCPAVLHSLKYFQTTSTGIPNFPRFVGTLEIDELLWGYCDSKGTLDVKDIAKSFFIKYPERLEFYRRICFHFLPNEAYINMLMSLFNQTGGTVCNLLQPV